MGRIGRAGGSLGCICGMRTGRVIGSRGRCRRLASSRGGRTGEGMGGVVAVGMTVCSF